MRPSMMPIRYFVTNSGLAEVQPFTKPTLSPVKEQCPVGRLASCTQMLLPAGAPAHARTLQWTLLGRSFATVRIPQPICNILVKLPVEGVVDWWSLMSSAWLVFHPTVAVEIVSFIDPSLRQMIIRHTVISRVPPALTQYPHTTALATHLKPLKPFVMWMLRCNCAYRGGIRIACRVWRLVTQATEKCAAQVKERREPSGGPSH